MRETRPLCFSCGFAEGLHVHEVRDDGEECVAWPDMDDFNAGFAALRSEVAALREALRYYADPQTYGLSGGSWDRIRGDTGRIARAALSRPGRPGNGGKP